MRMNEEAEDSKLTITEKPCVLKNPLLPDGASKPSCNGTTRGAHRRRKPCLRRPKTREANNTKPMQSDGRRLRLSECDLDEETFICDSCEAQFTKKRVLKNHIEFYHSPALVFQCSYCGLAFRYRNSLTRHVQIKHEPGHVFKCTKCDAVFQKDEDRKAHKAETHARKQFPCSICQKVFTHRNNLSRHMKTAHPDGSVGSVSDYACSVCDRKFLRQDMLKRHVKMVHNEGSKKYRCDLCGKDMKQKTSLRRHMLTVHAEMECATCHKKFSTKSDLIWHLRKEHSTEDWKCGVACVLCDATFRIRSHTIQHLEQVHQVYLETETRHMPAGDFDEWKKRLEQATCCQFVRSHISRNSDCTVVTFTCHRSGVLKGKSKRLRRAKLNGSKKLGGLCPAQISIRRRHDDPAACAVTHVKTHLGHAVGDEKELGYVFLSRDQRQEVAARIAAGVPLEHILTETTSPHVAGDRMKLINRQDLVNISRAAKQQPARGGHRGDPMAAVDLQAFVRQYADSILLYKRPDEVADPRYPTLAADDFVLIIMTDFQAKMLRGYGDDVVAVDGAARPAAGQYALQSLLVLDEYREAFPAAFAISSRADETLLDVFLACVRDRVGVLRPATLITSVPESCYESWCRVMEAAPAQRLYCTWHVNQAWLAQLKLVTNKEKQYALKKKLYELRLETYRAAFAEKLRAFLSDGDEETRAFVDYFARQFAGTAAYWANCFRTCRVESLDAAVRRLHGEERRTDSLPGVLQALHKYLRQREVDCQIKKIRGKLTPQLKRLRSRHDSIEKRRHFVMIERTRPDEWLVSSFAGQDAVAELYAVQRVQRQCEQCPLYCEKCDICLHEYRCSCRDSIKRANMCVHIHGLGVYLRPATERSVHHASRAEAEPPTLIRVGSTSPPALGDESAAQPCGRIETAELEGGGGCESTGPLSTAAAAADPVGESDWCFDFEYGSVHITLASDPATSEVTLTPADFPALEKMAADAATAATDWYGEYDSTAAAAAAAAGVGVNSRPPLMDEFGVEKEHSLGLQPSILVNPMDAAWYLGGELSEEPTAFMELYPTAATAVESMPMAGVAEVKEQFRDEMLSVLHHAESTEELNNLINKFIDQIT